MKTTTVAELQAHMTDTASADDVQTADPFSGLRIDVESADEWGMAMHKVRAALLDAGRVASEEQIRAETARLWGPAADPPAKPPKGGVTSVTLRTKIDGVESEPVTITGQQFHDLATGQLPGMPDRPAPKMVIRAPTDAEFGEDDEGFFISSTLRARAAVLIDRHPDLFEHLANLSVTYLWKKAGGKTKGAPTLGKCTKPTGLLKLFSESTFVIWLAADHCRDRYYVDPEIEQLLFHEMLHTSVGEPDEETGRGGGPVLVPHQLEIFDAEIEVYGLAGIALREAAPLFRAAVYDAPEQADPLLGDDLEHPEDYPAPDPMPADGVLIHPDGTPLTADEIAEQTAAELLEEIDGALHVSVDYVGPATLPAEGILEHADNTPLTYPDPIEIEFPSLSGAGVQVWPDGTPLTAEELADYEAAELRDDPAEFDDDEAG